MISSFKNPDTEAVFAGNTSRKYPADIQSTARRKLIQLGDAGNVNDMRIPPGNRMEKLDGDRKGQWSVRVNDQWRICFRWETGEDNPSEVEITDYH